MPNHVTTRCRVVGTAAEIERFKALAITEDDGRPSFNFRRIIPMPQEIEATMGEVGGVDMAVSLLIAKASGAAPYATLGLYNHEIAFVRREAGLPDDASIERVAETFLEKHPDLEGMAKRRLSAILATGYAYWYTWCIEKWGTKWGAYEFRVIEDGDDYVFIFETAWSFPTPIFTRLADVFPSLRFHCATFDEGSNFAGVGWFNPLEDEHEFTIGEATDEIYELAYGRPVDA